MKNKTITLPIPATSQQRQQGYDLRDSTTSKQVAYIARQRVNGRLLASSIQPLLEEDCDG
jgi:hypothetical protein